MKKQIKLITLVAAIAILVCGALGITALASETEPSLKIYSKNLSYGGTISIAFAVDAKNVGEEVELLVFESEPASLDATPAAVVKNYKTQTVHGTEALVFLTPGIPAKNMTNQVYAVARAADGEGGYIYSNMERYSVAEYAYDVTYYSKLGAEYTELASTLLDLGTQIQNLLPYEVDSDPRDYYYVSMYDQTLGYAIDGAYAAGIYKAGDTVTLPSEYTGAIPEGKTFEGWTSTVDGVITAEAGEEITVSSHAVFEPKFKSAPAIPGSGYYYSGTQEGTRYDFSTTGTDMVRGNKVVDGEIVVDGTYTRETYIANNLTSTFPAGTTYIFEADVMYKGGAPKTTDLNFAYVGFVYSDEATHNDNHYNMTTMAFTDAEGTAMTWEGFVFEKNVNYNVRFEYVTGEGTYKFYVNNELIKSEKATNGNKYVAGSDLTFAGYCFYSRSSSSYVESLDMTIDNVFLAPKGALPEGQIESYYETATTGTKLSFDTDGDMTGVITDNTHGSNGGKYGAVTVKDGKLTVANNPAWYSLAFENAGFDAGKTYANGTKFVFEADITMNGGSSSSTSGAAFAGFFAKTSTTYRNGDMLGYTYMTYAANESDSAVNDLNLFGAILTNGVARKVTFVYTVGSKTSLEVYVDGVQIANGTVTNNGADTNFHAFGFYFRGTSYTTDLSMTFDNVYLGIFEAE